VYHTARAKLGDSSASKGGSWHTGKKHHLAHMSHSAFKKVSDHRPPVAEITCGPPDQ